MKKIITLALAIFAFCNLNAQQFSGGFRTGASYWMDKKDGKCLTNATDGQNTTWDKEIFVRYSKKGKFAFEASMGHYSFGDRVTRTEYICVYGKDNINAITAHDVYESSQNVEWNLSAQYDMSCPALQEKCPVMKNLKSYMGVVVTPTFSRNTTKSYYPEGDFIGKSSNDVWTIWTGLTHTLVYNLCNKMYITSTVRMQIEPHNFFDDANIYRGRDSRLGFQLGVGYNFN